jgi:hypothetical protein
VLDGCKGEEEKEEKDVILGDIFLLKELLGFKIDE